MHVGCSGWRYSSWLGRFYPEHLDSGKFLEYYSKVFDYVEIGSDNRTPDTFTTKRWAAVTPDNFRFTAKFPKAMTYDRRLADFEGDLHNFLQAMQPLEDKLLALLIQLPPSLTVYEGIDNLEKLLSSLDSRFRYAIEFRQKSWFRKEIYEMLAKYKVCMAWSQLDAIRSPPELTTDFIYLRFIGDSSLDEKDPGKMQRGRLSEMQAWSNAIFKVRDKAKFGMAAANNHYAGFGPATANIFRSMVGLPKVTWGNETG